MGTRFAFCLKTTCKYLLRKIDLNKKNCVASKKINFTKIMTKGAKEFLVYFYILQSVFHSLLTHFFLACLLCVCVCFKDDVEYQKKKLYVMLLFFWHGFGITTQKIRNLPNES